MESVKQTKFCSHTAQLNDKHEWWLSLAAIQLSALPTFILPKPRLTDGRHATRMAIGVAPTSAGFCSLAE